MTPKEYKELDDKLRFKRQQYREKNLNFNSVKEHHKLELLRKEIYTLDRELKDYENSLGLLFTQNNRYNK